MAGIDDDEESQASSDNEVDETMEDLDDDMNGNEDGDVDGDGDGDVDAEGDNQDDNDDNDDFDDADETQDNLGASPTRTQPRNEQDDGRSPKRDRTGDNTVSTNGRAGSRQAVSTAVDGTDGPGPFPQDLLSNQSFDPFRPTLRPEAASALTYDIVPTIAAPHSTSINTITATPDMRWVFSGGADGWIRKFNWIDTANAKTLLTVAQRHPFVDSVTKAGVLMSYWENEENPYKDNMPQGPDDSMSLSPVYSLAVHHQGLWLLSGTETGVINLQSIRYDEGKRITSLNKHVSAVSVMKLSNDEMSVLSGSWDKTIIDWDLNTGQVKRTFAGSGSQISAIEMRPISHVPIPQNSFNEVMINGTSSGSIAEAKDAKANPMNGVDHPENGQASANGPSPGDSLFGGNDDNDSLFGDDTGAGGPGMGLDDDDDEFSRAIANGIQQQDANGDFNMADMEFPTGNADQPSSQQNPPTITSDDDRPLMELLSSTNQPESDTQDTLDTPAAVAAASEPPSSESTFLDAAIDGTLRIWDRRQPNPVARLMPPRSVPPWCMHACWSPDGNFIYAGRRNGTVEEYSMHKSLAEPTRTLRFPAGSGAVSALRAMPNGRQLICASHDILRLYDLKDEDAVKHARVPFLIVPGHRTGVVSQLYIDPTCSYMISTGGTRGWEGSSTEVLLGYEIAYGR